MDKITEKYSLYNGDCVEVIKEIPDNSIHLGISSFPFANLYTYSDSPFDFSNVADIEEYFQQLDFLIPEIYRVIVPGRSICLHLKQIPEFKGRDGHIGLVDFRGMMIKAFQKHGFIFHNEICIWTDPQIEATRTKANSILFKTYRTAAEQTRVGMADYIIVMRKWTDDETTHVLHEETDEQFKLWTEIASPCWFDISRTNVLNAKLARNNLDEKHMTPLQIDTVETLIKWYSNENEVIFDPFDGIGTVVYCAIKNNRLGVGIELKEEYHNLAVSFCEEIAEEDKQQMNMFDLIKKEDE